MKLKKKKKKKRPNNARTPYNSVGTEKVATFEKREKAWCWQSYDCLFFHTNIPAITKTDKNRNTIESSKKKKKKNT
jgi:hypothetical protein